MQRIALLGATGSIGDSALKVLRLHPERFHLSAASALTNIAKLAEICLEFRPQFAIVGNQTSALALRERLRNDVQTEILIGAQALIDIAKHPDIDTVLAAIVGAAGLPSTLAAAKAGKRLLIANKEALVIGGKLVTEAAKASGALLLPIDSEHNALFQCLPQIRPLRPIHGIEKLWLTASGGPFRGKSLQQLHDVTPAQACQHPTWQMGKKISVDSATLLNKGLEVIEAFWLFGMAAEQIDVVVHPQSIVHSMVQYADGTFLAQLGSPDMCTPIAYALSYPDRITAGVAKLDPFQLQALQFEPPDHHAFPCLKIAFDALKAGGSAPVVLNAAGEIAVEQFLNGAIRFTDIPALINECLQASPISSLDSLEAVLTTDALTRQLAASFAPNFNKPPRVTLS